MVDLLVCCSILLKIEPEWQFLKVDSSSFGKVNMAKIYERRLASNIRQGKSCDWFDPRGQNLSGEDSNCMVEHLQIAWMMDCFFFLISEFLRLFQKMTCVLSNEHESQIVAIIGTLLDDINF